ncbi:Diaminopimelate epimerase [Candidatus Karelsulcia muelleri]|uniref:Diaminopimelate epimerase n=1 Tax=Candidatus Karelsulcia muelleri TaxID=336810 RepID=A0A654M6Y2_9FLAO|nr:diaminopimelate epimerase [Candidatus Karelsulcia muelleri]AGS33470.1 Diaminopimelate epimerase [Candidatus Karelsulcia muelleri str. Sulcia-ALF]ALP70210.1 Diaminopimelate epimerase [Candidatus Karelsulcia muelleri]QND78456.1 Diaminopimelate epimerase [Candidatus Karelsulcia muelleri]
MKIIFFKYKATGNDFIIINNTEKLFLLSEKIIKNMCNRNLGIGADGLILIDKIKKYDFYMKYYNSDGKEGTMCGNGGRCSVHFAKKIGIINNNNTLFKTIDGSHYASIKKNIVSLNMKNIELVEVYKKHICINTGSPHHILFIDNNKNYINVYNKGRKIRFNQKNIKKGVNVNFVKVKKHILNVRTYERGVENETFSCGTGVTASAIAAYNIKKLLYNKIIVQTLGGTLQVKFEKLLKSYKEIFLKGEVTFVYKGILKLAE